MLNANRFVNACGEAIADEKLRELDIVGSIDQLEATDLVVNFTDWPRGLEELYARDWPRHPGN